MPQTPESRLAHLGFQLASPSRLLRPYVRSYWYFRHTIPLSRYQDEYMHPRGGFGIAFNFGDQLQLDGRALNDRVFLDGSNTVSRKMSFLGCVELMGIRFHEGGAYPFLAVPLNELRNATNILDALDRPGLLRLHSRLYEAKSPSTRIALIEEWLIGRLLLGKERNALIPASLAILRERDRDFPISDLAREFTISQRQLERLYQIQVGMSPKQYSRLSRVEFARLTLKRGNGQSVARLAAELGFFDQSHFIREFSAVIGVTPYAYMKRSHKKPIVVSQI